MCQAEHKMFMFSRWLWQFHSFIPLPLVRAPARCRRYVYISTADFSPFLSIFFVSHRLQSFQNNPPAPHPPPPLCLGTDCWCFTFSGPRGCLAPAPVQHAAGAPANEASDGQGGGSNVNGGDASGGDPGNGGDDEDDDSDGGGDDGRDGGGQGARVAGAVSPSSPLAVAARTTVAPAVAARPTAAGTAAVGQSRKQGK